MALLLSLLAISVYLDKTALSDQYPFSVHHHRVYDGWSAGIVEYSYT